MENELSSDSKNVYNTDQMVNIIRQKYYPPATADQVKSVLKRLEGDVTKVASETNHIAPDHQVILWQGRTRYNQVNGIDDRKFLYRSRL